MSVGWLEVVWVLINKLIYRQSIQMYYTPFYVRLLCESRNNVSAISLYPSHNSDSCFFIYANAKPPALSIFQYDAI